MWSPWVQLRDEYPHWHAKTVHLPEGTAGATDFRHQIIWLSDRLTQAGRRSTLAHELEHIRQGHSSRCCQQIEDRVEEIAARNLIPLDMLGAVMMWTNSLTEAADELTVDTGTLAMRLRTLTPKEQRVIDGRLRSREETA